MSQELLEAILEELRAQRVPEPLWSTTEIGMFFGVGKKTACGIAALPSFPNPVDAPGVGRRWLPSEVKGWAQRNRRNKQRERR